MREGPFKPSEVNILGSFPPLCATMGKTEAEVAAALLVDYLALNGDDWGPATPKQLGEHLQNSSMNRGTDRDPWPSIIRNPFAQPSFGELVMRGFATWQSNGIVWMSVTFTATGIEAMRKWVR